MLRLVIGLDLLGRIVVVCLGLGGGAALGIVAFVRHACQRCGLGLRLRLAKSDRFIAGMLGLELLANLGGDVVHDFHGSVRGCLDRAHRIRGGVGDVADILQDLVEAHDLEIRRIHGQGHAIDEWIDLVYSGLERFRDALHAFKRRVELLLHFVDRGARFAHGDDKLDHEPHQSHAEHHVHDRQNHAHNFAEIHQTPPSYIHIRRQL